MTGARWDESLSREGFQQKTHGFEKIRLKEDVALGSKQQVAQRVDTRDTPEIELLDIVTLALPAPSRSTLADLRSP